MSASMEMCKIFVSCQKMFHNGYIFTHNFMKSLSQYDRFEWVFMSAWAQARDPWLFLVTLQFK